MTSPSDLDCFKAAVEHHAPSRILYYGHFIPSLAERICRDLHLDPKTDLGEHFGMFRPREVRPKTPPGHSSPDFSAYFQNVEKSSGAFINHLGVLETPGGPFHFTHFTSPLRDAKTMRDLETFPYPSVQGFPTDHMAQQVQEAHARGQVAVTWVGHMYEDSWQIRGYEPFLMDLADQPEWCEYILDRVTERNMEVACAGARAGVDYLRTGDDVANQRTMTFSIEQWRRFMKPRWARVYAAARAIKPDIQIWYHSDGNMMSIIPELIEIGVTLLNPVQPECLNPQEVKRQFGSRVTLDGTIGTQTTMPFGTPVDVRQKVRESVETLGLDGGLILSPTHVLEPEVPTANIQAFVDAAKEFGRLG